MKTKIRFKPRQSGKTTKLIKKSSKNNIPIIVGSLENVKSVEYMAKELGLQIPKPLTYSQLLDHQIISKNGNKVKVYFDDLEYLLGNISNRYNIDILEINISDEREWLKDRGFI